MISFGELNDLRELSGEITALLRKRGVSPLKAGAVLGGCVLAELEEAGVVKIDRAKVIALFARWGANV